jgi:hypothetical protein
MELTLTQTTGTQIAVQCDGQPSHTFDLLILAPDPAIPGRPPQPLDDPVAYGAALYAALFPPQSPAAHALAAGPQRLLLVTDDPTDAVPWELLHGPDGFLVLDLPLLRGLPPDKRIPPPDLTAGLHIVAVPSNPLDPGVLPLNIDGEWQRLKEVIQPVPAALKTYVSVVPYSTYLSSCSLGLRRDRTPFFSVRTPNPHDYLVT